LSMPLFVSLVSSQCGQGSDCSMKVMLQHQLRSSTLSRLAIDMTSTPVQSSSSRADGSRSNLTSFEVECAPGVFANYSFDCPSGEVLTISCNGSSSPLRGRHSCPVKTSSIVCQTKVQNTDVVTPSSSPSDGEVISCRLSEHNESMTVCICDLSEVSAIGDSSSVTFSITSIERSVLTEFVSTWETVPSLSSGDVAGSWLVLATVGGLGGLFVILIWLGSQYDSFEKNHLTRRSGWVFTGISPSDPTLPQSSPTQPSGNEDLHSIEESLPSIFKSNSLWSKFKEEMRVYHRWLGIS
jgi:hypothetical protein